MRMTCTVLAVTLLTATLSACTTTGAGYGNVRNGADTRVKFAWQGEDGVSGQMTASISDGRSLAGRYFQITHDTRLDGLGPLWSGWGPESRGWPYWYTQPDPKFVQHYRDSVLANLSAADGQLMWCNLRLRQPSSGIAGGGQGVCQLPDGGTVDAMFPPAWGRR